MPITQYHLTEHRSITLGLFFKPVSLFALSAQLPYNALGPELAVSAGVGAGLAVLEALPAIADSHLLTGHVGFTTRMIFAFHD